MPEDGLIGHLVNNVLANILVENHCQVCNFCSASGLLIS